MSNEEGRDESGEQRAKSEESQDDGMENEDKRLEKAANAASSILNPQSSIRYIGLDISKPALKIARQNAQKHLKSSKNVKNNSTCYYF